MIPSSPRLVHARDFRDLHAGLSLWLPLACWMIVYASGLFGSKDLYDYFVVTEISLVEIATVLVLIAAIIMGTGAWRSARKLDMRLLSWWLLLGTLGCIYFAGEESSWGQWYLRWDTPAAWQALNEQGETNLHNLAGVGALLDQLPRLLLTLGALIGGILVPLYTWMHKSPMNPARLWYWIWPTLVALPTAVLGVALARADRLVTYFIGPGWTDQNFESGEIKELMLAFFLFVYLGSLRLRLQQLRDDLSV